MKHTFFKRTLLLCLFCAVLLSSFLVLPAVAYSYDETVTVGKGKTSIGPDDVKDYNLAEKFIIAEGVKTIEPETFLYSFATSVQLPSTLTTIGEKAFNGSRITSITVPDGVTKISEQCFSFCDELKTVKMGKNVTEIGEEAFEFCKALTEITIPEGVTKIGEYAFQGCDALNTVYYNAINCTPNDGTFGFFDYENTITKLVIGLKVESIPERAFCDSKSLESVVIPANVKTIGVEAFAYCDSITALTLEEGIEKIEAKAFYNCDALTAVVIPTSVTEIGTGAFGSCDKLKEIYIEDESILYGSIDYSDGTQINGEKPSGFDELVGIIAGGAIAVVILLLVLLVILLLFALTVQIIYLVGNIKLTQQYCRRKNVSAAGLTVLAVFVTLLGFGFWYLLIFAILNHTAAKQTP
ncbi:MAG: leucine-rich repeat domain-containing protein [Clostridia bacterium]|nr:leucine-rich repeat domain-containing protein [Clostridia bacterium]